MLTVWLVGTSVTSRLGEMLTIRGGLRAQAPRRGASIAARRTTPRRIRREGYPAERVRRPRPARSLPLVFHQLAHLVRQVGEARRVDEHDRGLRDPVDRAFERVEAAVGRAPSLVDLL